MYLLEALFSLTLLTLLVSQTSRRIPRRVSLSASAAGLAAILLMLLAGQLRWQMAPGYLVWLALLLSLLIRSSGYVVLRRIGGTFGMALLGLGVVLSRGMPVVTLDAPDGSYAVGSAAFTLTDASRNNARFNAPEENREVFVRVWYPGQLSSDSPRPNSRTFWQDLYAGEQNFLTRLAGYLGGIETHTFDSIAAATDEASFPLILFSHGMLGHPEQNTLLMEHLASHGYIVASVGHPYMAMRLNLSGGRSTGADLNAFAAATSQRSDNYEESVETRVRNAAGAEERSRIWLEHYANSSGLNELMQVWVDDLRFVADAMAKPHELGPLPDQLAARIRPDRIGVMGMSFGGSAVAEFCKTDRRCAAGLNLDGGAYGSHQSEPLRTPYLALVGPHNENLYTGFMNTSDSDFFEVLVEETAHNDFMDATLIAPALKWMNVNGAIEGQRMIEIVNSVSLAFFERYLRGGPALQIDTSRFPELTVATNLSSD